MQALSLMNGVVVECWWAPSLYDELLPLSDTDWRIEKLGSEIANTPKPVMIWKPRNNISEVAEQRRFAFNDHQAKDLFKYER